jgi:hypothetical protein
MMDYSNTTKGLGKGTLAYTRCLKRARLLIDKEISHKKLIPVYLACEKQGHSLQDYWYLFKDKRPEGVIIRNTCIKRVLKKVEKNKDFTKLQRLDLKNKKIRLNNNRMRVRKLRLREKLI